MEEQRRRLIREIEADVREVARRLGKTSLAPPVMRAMARVPRHEFVSEAQAGCAYVNHALPIGHGQTVSQPFVVALMTDLMEVGGEDVVLEVGTGSGYQAAVLAEIVKRVYTVEVISELGEQARERLQRLGYENVEVRVGDGYTGWPEHAPYDGVIITAATEQAPQALIDQLRPGRRLVLPLGVPYGSQSLTVIEKDEKGRLASHSVLPVAFVPLQHRAPEPP